MLTKKKKIRQSIRTTMRLIRKKLTPQEQYQASEKITRYILNDYRVQQVKHIGIFISCDGEIQTNSLISKLLSMGKKIYLPIIPPFKKSKKLLFIQYKLDTHLILNNNFKIYEPKWNKQSLISIKKLNVIFIPLVAFDKYGHRLGMGCGFYDNTLKHWKYNKKKLLIGLAHDCQYSQKNIPIQSWDINLPEIITPSFHWNWKKHITYKK